MNSEDQKKAFFDRLEEILKEMKRGFVPVIFFEIVKILK